MYHIRQAAMAAVARRNRERELKAIEDAREAKARQEAYRARLEGVLRDQLERIVGTELAEPMQMAGWRVSDEDRQEYPIGRVDDLRFALGWYCEEWFVSVVFRCPACGGDVWALPPIQTLADVGDRLMEWGEGARWAHRCTTAASEPEPAPAPQSDMRAGASKANPAPAPRLCPFSRAGDYPAQDCSIRCELWLGEGFGCAFRSMAERLIDIGRTMGREAGEL